MGVPIEINWFLVIETKDNIKESTQGLNLVEKDENRQYPVGGLIPLLTKDRSYFDIVKVRKVVQEGDKTLIYFEHYECEGISQEVINHYYKLYTDMKVISNE